MTQANDVSAARCAHHPDRPAAMPCARCGTFVCSGCIVSGDLCAPCKSRLFREGVPYSESEKARKTARHCLRAGTWGLRLLSGFGLAGVLILAGVTAGALPTIARYAGLAAIGVSALFGLGTIGVSVVGYTRSNRGRPGPAVAGVFPVSAAAIMVFAGLLPVLIAIFAVATGAESL